MSLLVACSGSDSPSVSYISKELMCNCGCGEVLSTCDCETAEELTSFIKEKVAQGQSKEQIIQLFVDQYGEEILAPRTHS
jgi:cytochrome c-type biogenesis protein CcmH/NrfF